jgi:hypothetical protein
MEAISDGKLGEIEKFDGVKSDGAFDALRGAKDALKT